jgi:hypothetical protein
MELRHRRDPNHNTPLSLEEQTFVFTKEQLQLLLPALESTQFVKGTAMEEGIPADSWGVNFTADNQAIHPVISNMVRVLIANNRYLTSHTPKGRTVIHRISVNKMDSSPPSPARNRFEQQMHWHADGADKNTSLLTVVFTVYNREWDSEKSPGARSLGGRVGLADRPSGSAVFTNNKRDRVRAGRVCNYYPKTNSLYIIPGHQVDHAVYRVHDPNTVRFSIVVFLKPKSRFLFFGKYRPVNEYLRMTWAIGFLGKDAVPLFCPRCYRVFSTARQLQDHGYRHRGTCVEKEAKKRQRPQIK